MASGANGNPVSLVGRIAMSTLYFECMNDYNTSMKAIVSEKGQVTIPKAIRSRLGIRPGTVLDFSAEEGRLVAVKEQAEDAISRWRGKGSLPGGLTVDEYLAEVRG
jgi:antitoxin PrlF